MTEDANVIHREGLYEIRRFKNGSYRLLLSDQAHHLLRYHYADFIDDLPEQHRNFASVFYLIKQTIAYAAIEMEEDEKERKYSRTDDELPF